MTTAYATSGDGIEWTWQGTVLAPRPGTWDQRGARLTVVPPDGRAAYDGRASREENWFASARRLPCRGHVDALRQERITRQDKRPCDALMHERLML